MRTYSILTEESYNPQDLALGLGRAYFGKDTNFNMALGSSEGDRLILLGDKNFNLTTGEVKMVLNLPGLRNAYQPTNNFTVKNHSSNDEKLEAAVKRLTSELDGIVE